MCRVDLRKQVLADQTSSRVSGVSVQVQRGIQLLEPALQAADMDSKRLPWSEVFAVLDDDTRPAPADVPRTGEARWCT